MSCYMLRRWKWCLRPDFGLDFTNHPTLAHPLPPPAQGLYEYRSHISQWAETVRCLTCGTMAKHFPLLWQFALEKLKVCGQILGGLCRHNLHSWQFALEWTNIRPDFDTCVHYTAFNHAESIHTLLKESLWFQKPNPICVKQKILFDLKCTHIAIFVPICGGICGCAFSLISQYTNLGQPTQPNPCQNE